MAKPKPKPKPNVKIELTPNQLKTMLIALRNYSNDCLAQATREKWIVGKGATYVFEKKSVDYKLGMQCQKIRQKLMKLKTK